MYCSFKAIGKKPFVRLQLAYIQNMYMHAFTCFRMSALFSMVYLLLLRIKLKPVTKEILFVGLHSSTNMLIVDVMYDVTNRSVCM